MSDEKDTQVTEATGATEEAKAEVAEETPAEPEVKEEKKEEPASNVADAKEESEGQDVEIPAKFKALVEQVETMSVLELHELVKLLEKKFGVSAVAAVAVAGAGEAGEEKTEFDVELASDGGAKIPVMKVVKELLGLGLKEAKDLVEGVPSMLKTGVKKADAEEIKKKIEEAGGKVNIK